jgi:tape measure domain-containing protein
MDLSYLLTLDSTKFTSASREAEVAQQNVTKAVVSSQAAIERMAESMSGLYSQSARVVTGQQGMITAFQQMATLGGGSLALLNQRIQQTGQAQQQLNSYIQQFQSGATRGNAFGMMAQNVSGWAASLQAAIPVAAALNQQVAAAAKAVRELEQAQKGAAATGKAWSSNSGPVGAPLGLMGGTGIASVISRGGTNGVAGGVTTPSAQPVRDYTAAIAALNLSLRSTLAGSLQANTGLNALSTVMASIPISGVALGLTAIGVGLVGIAVKSISAGAHVAVVREALTGMLGDAGKAREMVSQIIDFSGRTMFDPSQVIRYGQRLLAMGMAADEVVPTLKVLVNQVTALGGDTQTVDRLVLAISQISAKARLSAQDMRQMAEIPVPAWDILAKKISETTGKLVTIGEVQKLSERGMISGPAAAQVLVEEMEKRSKDAAAKVAQSTLGMWRQISNQGQQAFIAIGDTIDPFVNRMTSALLRGAQEWVKTIKIGLTPTDPTLQPKSWAGIVSQMPPEIVGLLDLQDVQHTGKAFPSPTPLYHPESIASKKPAGPLIVPGEIAELKALKEAQETLAKLKELRDSLQSDKSVEGMAKYKEALLGIIIETQKIAKAQESLNALLASNPALEAMNKMFDKHGRERDEIEKDKKAWQEYFLAIFEGQNAIAEINRGFNFPVVAAPYNEFAQEVMGVPQLLEDAASVAGRVTKTFVDMAVAFDKTTQSAIDGAGATYEFADALQVIEEEGRHSIGAVKSPAEELAANFKRLEASSEAAAESMIRPWGRAFREQESMTRRFIRQISGTFAQFGSGLFLEVLFPQRQREQTGPTQAQRDQQDLFSRLQQGAQELAGKGYANAGERLADLVDKIQNAGTVAQANAIAIKYFGSAGVEMAIAIRAGGQAVREAVEEIRKVGPYGKSSFETAQDAIDETSTRISRLQQLFQQFIRGLARAGLENLFKRIFESKTMDLFFAKLSAYIKDLLLKIPILQDILRKIGIIPTVRTSPSPPGAPPTPPSNQPSVSPGNCGCGSGSGGINVSLPIPAGGCLPVCGAGGAGSVPGAPMSCAPGFVPTNNGCVPESRFGPSAPIDIPDIFSTFRPCGFGFISTPQGCIPDPNRTGGGWTPDVWGPTNPQPGEWPWPLMDTGQMVMAATRPIRSRAGEVPSISGGTKIGGGETYIFNITGVDLSSRESIRRNLEMSVQELRMRRIWPDR